MFHPSFEVSECPVYIYIISVIYVARWFMKVPDFQAEKRPQTVALHHSYPTHLRPIIQSSLFPRLARPNVALRSTQNANYKKKLRNLDEPATTMRLRATLPKPPYTLSVVLFINPTTALPATAARTRTDARPNTQAS